MVTMREYASSVVMTFIYYIIIMLSQVDLVINQAILVAYSVYAYFHTLIHLIIYSAILFTFYVLLIKYVLVCGQRELSLECHSGLENGGRLSQHHHHQV